MVLPTITHIFRKEHLAQRLLKSARILKLRNYFAVSGFSQPMFYPPFFFFSFCLSLDKKRAYGFSRPISHLCCDSHEPPKVTLGKSLF